ncbi:MAG: hypothetical protein V3U58_00830 [Thermodesulfobacteriota bacterium]
MKLHCKSILRWAISLSLIIIVMGINPKLTEYVLAHGPELGDDESSEGKEEEEKGPNGGQVLVFGNNHLEFTADHESGEIVLFLLDENLVVIPVPESYSGIVYLTIEDGSKKTLTLNHSTVGSVSHLEVNTGVKEIGPFKAVVSLKIGEKRENFRFNWSPTSHPH